MTTPMRSVEEIIKGAIAVELSNHGPLGIDGCIRVIAAIADTLEDYAGFWVEQGEPEIGDRVMLLQITIEYLCKQLQDGTEGDYPF